MPPLVCLDTPRFQLFAAADWDGVWTGRNPNCVEIFQPTGQPDLSLRNVNNHRRQPHTYCRNACKSESRAVQEFRSNSFLPSVVSGERILRRKMLSPYPHPALKISALPRHEPARLRSASAAVSFAHSNRAQGITDILLGARITTEQSISNQWFIRRTPSRSPERPINVTATRMTMGQGPRGLVMKETEGR